MTQLDREFLRKEETKKKLGEIKELHLIAIIMGLEKYGYIRKIVEGRNGWTPALIHELSVTLMMNIGFLFESLHNYNCIKKDICKTNSYSNNEKFKECVHILNSKKATKFKGNALRVTRNEGAFHNDLSAIADYFESYANDRSKIWSTNELGENYSPIAYAISAHTLNRFFEDDPEQDGVYISELANSLLYVANELVNEWIYPQ
ncbi:hypothetical protein [Paenibacillus xylanivorans]|uniref:Uncharacterized protein n=1 Tax=Paenibacillus xylanivorans TaxID=1705561 RepID=A0A0N0UHZ5_9BACL|nr:hypothetical protein [Paenibacillus xylanivorans]KOY16711.1 hypothetical protein AMS66_09930 [Paenibacillus xylanivorans]